MDQFVEAPAVAAKLSGKRARDDTRQRAALSVDGLTQTYGGIVALDRVSFSVSSGELVAVVGYSGSGKSTLLRMIAGLERPQAGTVAIDGRTMSGSRTFVPPEQRGVGMMFQDYALFPHLSVLKNVMFGLRRLPVDEARAAARRALQQVGLADRERAYPHMLSGGEQQRVALARALVPEPHLLLMDEPFSNLDRMTRETVREETVSVLRESGSTVILVTHDHDDATRYADRIMVMWAGGIAQIGTTEDLYRRPASLEVARFFCEFNEVVGKCRHGAIATAIGTFPCNGIAEGAAATICIRHADIAITASADRGLTGRVLGRLFLGSAQLLEVRVAGLDRPLQVEASPEMVTELGAEVSLAVSRERALVFG